MTEWFYARDGRQEGPVSHEKLIELARSGGLNPGKDLVWNASMKDWTPAGRVQGLFASEGQPPIPSDPSNPYAAPQSQWVAPVPAVGALEEITPGSEPIVVTACVKRAFDLGIRHIGMVLLMSVVYLIITTVFNVAMSVMDTALGLSPMFPVQQVRYEPQSGSGSWFVFLAASQNGASWVNMILSNVFSVFIMLGLIRMALNLVSGREVSFSMLFSGGKNLLPALVANLLFYAVFIIGLLLLVAPGIYIALRYGLFMYAMVDRNLGVMDSFAHSSKLTTNNRGNLFLLGLLGILILIAGLVALCVGLLFAMPVFFLSWIVAYRWMQYGHRAALDVPGTRTPMLAGV